MNEENKLARWLDDRMEGDELREFQSSPEFETYSKIREFSAQLKTPAMDMDATYAAIVAKRNTARQADPVKVIKFQPWFGRIAAIFLIALGLTFFLYTANTTTMVADAGNRTQFDLPDNSEVVLNAGSEASYKSWNWDKNRQLQLDGEAYFKVAKGQTFDVNTKLGKVTVVGTQFNVKARNNRFDVTCYEGKVKVTYNNREVLLTPGMSIAYEDGKTIPMRNTVVTQPGWLAYEVYFTSEKPENIIAELERQYNITIDVKNTKLTQQPYTGPMPMNNLDEALDMFTTQYQLKAEKTGKNKIVLSSE